MNLGISFTAVGLLVAASPAFSDGAVGQPPKSTKQLIRECVAQQTQQDTSLSRTAARSQCRERVKQEKDPTGTNKAGAGAPDKP